MERTMLTGTKLSPLDQGANLMPVGHERVRQQLLERGKMTPHRSKAGGKPAATESMLEKASVQPNTRTAYRRYMLEFA